MPGTLLRIGDMEMIKSSPLQETHFLTEQTEKLIAMLIEAYCAMGTFKKKQITLAGFRQVP